MAERLMITCPATGQPTYTGISMDQESFERPNSVMGSNKSQCQHCGELHTWSKIDAFFIGQQPEQSR